MLKALFHDDYEICAVSEKIVIHYCPDEVVKEIAGNESEVAVFWKPPIAELLALNGSSTTEQTILPTGQTRDYEPEDYNGSFPSGEQSILSTEMNYEPGDCFPVGSTQVEYKYRSQKADDESCKFIVKIGKFLTVFGIL